MLSWSNYRYLTQIPQLGSSSPQSPLKSVTSVGVCFQLLSVEAGLLVGQTELQDGGRFKQALPVAPLG